MGYILPKSEALRQSLEKPKQHLEKTLLTIPEACDYLRVSRWSVYRLIQAKRLESILIGRRRLVPEVAVRQLIEQLRREAHI